MKIQILVDNPDSWFNDYAEDFVEKLEEQGQDVVLLRDYRDIEEGDLVFLLSCNEIVPSKFLEKNNYNLVVHASAVPEGRGWSPLTWQVLEGKNKIPISLFEAVEKVDSGSVYLRDSIEFEGHELINEMRDKLGRKVIEMCLRFVGEYPKVEGEPQKGEGSYYERRTPEDSELDIDKSLKEQFDLLRVVDNEQYPAFFKYKGHRYVVKIYKEEE